MPLDSGATGPADDLVSEVEFTEPPGKIMYDWAGIAAQLRDRPMQWALIFSNDRYSVVNAIRIGGIGAVHPDLGFETRTARNVRHPVRKCDLYMRYNPNKAKPMTAILHEARNEVTE